MAQNWLSDDELEATHRALDRIVDLVRDHVTDLESRLAGTKLCGDPLGLTVMLTNDIAECNRVLDRSGLGTFERLHLLMDLVDAKGI